MEKEDAIHIFRGKEIVAEMNLKLDIFVNFHCKGRLNNYVGATVLNFKKFTMN